MPKDKNRIPHVGEVVYLKGDIRRTAMYLDRVYTRDNVKYGYCLWKSHEFVDDELVSEEREQEFLLSDLTIWAEGIY